MSDDPSHLAARVAIDVAGTDRLSITVRSQMPIARGLGSSAALAVAAAAAAGAKDPLAVAARMDGHADNAAASAIGGLVAAARVKGGVQAVRLALDVSLAFVAIVPDMPLSTARARQVLPTEVSRDSATFNLSRMALLIAGLADSRVLIAEATEDRLHQDYRSPLFPAAPKLLSAMAACGALAVCWSGAGPSLLGICHGVETPGSRGGGHRGHGRRRRARPGDGAPPRHARDDHRPRRHRPAASMSTCSAPSPEGEASHAHPPVPRPSVRGQPPPRAATTRSAARRRSSPACVP